MLNPARSSRARPSPRHLARRARPRNGLIIGARLGVLVVSGALAAIVFSGFGRAPESSPRIPPRHGDAGAGIAAQAVGFNRPVRDGGFEFTVSTMECGIAEVGTKHMGLRAEGQYCRVSATVRNVGSEARSFFASYQYAYGPAGEKYGADATAQVYQGDATNHLGVGISPGNAASGTFLFDIPAGAKIARLELHETAFSPGVAVTQPPAGVTGR